MKRYIDIENTLDLDGPIDEVIAGLIQLQERFGSYEDLRINEDYCYEGGCTYDLQRLETDDEYKNRLKEEEVLVKSREDREREEYNRLKKKFDK